MVLFDALMDDVLVATQSSRTTLRLVGVNGSAHLIAERRSGVEVPSMAAGNQVDPRAYPTYAYLEETQDLLVQNDTRVAAVSPPPDLVDVHRVFAQMLAPVVVHGAFVGTISVHLIGVARNWSPEQVDALRRCRSHVEDLLTQVADCRLAATTTEHTITRSSK
jgi:GAF domain-containing protein